jgi:hypothetical protein
MYFLEKKSHRVCKNELQKQIWDATRYLDNKLVEESQMKSLLEDVEEIIDEKNKAFPRHKACQISRVKSISDNIDSFINISVGEYCFASWALVKTKFVQK